jgi:hypothetical protein
MKGDSSRATRTNQGFTKMNFALVIVELMQHTVFALAESPTCPPLSGLEDSMLYQKLYEVLLCIFMNYISEN